MQFKCCSKSVGYNLNIRNRITCHFHIQTSTFTNQPRKLPAVSLRQKTFSWEIFQHQHGLDAKQTTTPNNCTKQSPKGSLWTPEDSSILGIPTNRGQHDIIDCFLGFQQYIPSWNLHNTATSRSQYYGDLIPYLHAGQMVALPAFVSTLGQAATILSTTQDEEQT